MSEMVYWLLVLVDWSPFLVPGVIGKRPVNINDLPLQSRRENMTPAIELGHGEEEDGERF